MTRLTAPPREPDAIIQPISRLQIASIVAAIMFLGWVLLILCPNVGGN